MISQARARTSWLRHLAIVGAITAMAVVLCWKAASLPAYDGDNLYSLSLGPSIDARPSLLSLLTEPYSDLPAYRPVPLFTLWLQYKLGGTAPHSYLVVNLVLLLAACVVLYALVYRTTASWPVACAAAVALLLDPRVTKIITTVVERQTAIACLLGFLALLVVLTPPARARPTMVGITVFLLLLLASLSKEYGLAFIAAAVLAALLNRSAGSRAVVIASVGAVLTYIALRWLLAAGATGDYCQNMGYFDQARYVCFGHSHGNGAILLAGGAALAQHAYNIGAAFLGTFFPFLFSKEGAVTASFDVPTVAWSFIVTALATVAWIRAPRQALPFFALIVANACLSLEIYRERNLVIAVAALYAAASLGAIHTALWLRTQGNPLAQLGIAAAAVALWAGYQSSGRIQYLDTEYKHRTDTLAEMKVKVAKKRDPCRYLTRTFAAQLAGQSPVLPKVVEYVKLRYHLPDPLCRRDYG